MYKKFLTGQYRVDDRNLRLCRVYYNTSRVLPIFAKKGYCTLSKSQLVLRLITKQTSGKKIQFKENEKE